MAGRQGPKWNSKFSAGLNKEFHLNQTIFRWRYITATALGTANRLRAGWSRVRIPIGAKIFFKVSRPTLGPTQPPILWVAEFPSEGKAAGSWRTTNLHKMPSLKKSTTDTSIPSLYALVLWATGERYLYLCLLPLSITRYFMHDPPNPKHKERTKLPLHISSSSQRLRPINGAVL